MYCKYCGTRMADDARFCPSCGAQTQEQGGGQQAWQAEAQPPAQQPYGQDHRPSAQPSFQQVAQNFIPPASQSRNAVRRNVRRGFHVGRAQARLCGIPISGTAAVIILIILVIVCVILNKTGALS